jgi:hypothetical protein
MPLTPLVHRPKRQFTVRQNRSSLSVKIVPVNDLGQMANEVIE